MQRQTEMKTMYSIHLFFVAYSMTLIINSVSKVIGSLGHRMMPQKVSENVKIRHVNTFAN